MYLGFLPYPVFQKGVIYLSKQVTYLSFVLIFHFKDSFVPMFEEESGMEIPCGLQVPDHFSFQIIFIKYFIKTDLIRLEF